MAEPVLAATRLAGTAAGRVLLVVGPSLGTAAGTLWGPCAAQLAGFEVVGWDLPGHWLSRPAAEGFTVKDLAASVRALANAAAGGRPACYAGVSLGGAVAFELGLDPGPFRAVAAVAAASRMGEAFSWTERAELVRRAGTPVMVAGSSQRWFAPGFLERGGDTAGRLLQTLSDTDDESCSLACEALAEFDRRPDLDRVTVPFLLGPGEHGGVVPPARAQQDADAITGSRLQVFAGCGHLPPADLCRPRRARGAPCNRIREARTVSTTAALGPDEIAARVARDIPAGSFVNLGIGLPTKVANYLTPQQGVLLHTENGMLGMGPEAHGDDADPDLVNAGKVPVTELPGASYFHHADSFAMMRGGHLDICVLGAYQVSARGDLANWHTGRPGDIPAVGGAMDLALGAKQTFVMMRLLARDGSAKIVPECTYPLTAVGCVSRIYTDLAVFLIDGRGVVVRELFGTQLGRLRDLLDLPLVDGTRPSGSPDVTRGGTTP